jgi:hypothetical protein
MVKIFEKLPAGVPLTFNDIVRLKTRFSKPSSTPRCGNG